MTVVPVKRATRSKLKPKKERTLDGTPIKKCYCRRCMTEKDPKGFYDATDTALDRNGKMSICIDCIDELYSKTFMNENDVSKSILKMCRMLNVLYLDTAVTATLTHVGKLYSRNGDIIKGIFGIYKSKMSSMSMLNQLGTFTFSEPYVAVTDQPMQDDEIENAHDVKRFWGEGMSFEEYEYLEEELDDWKKTHKSDTKAELTLLKEICFKQLEIRKTRNLGQTVDGALKTLQDLMKTASVDPAKAAIANAGKSQDTFSAFIKTIEQSEPADYYKDKELFKDFDNIDFYFKKYITRPLKNFITQSRDFSVDNSDDGNEYELDLLEEVNDGGKTESPISEG